MEWQPARITFKRSGHKYKSSQWDYLEFSLVRVRPVSQWVVSDRVCSGKHFEIHPDDLPTVGSGRAVCEHEILTD